MKKTKISFAIVVGLVVTGCSGFFLGKDNSPSPTPIDQSVSTSLVHKAWATSIGGGNKNGSGLRFTIGNHDAHLIYVANEKGVVTALDSATGKKQWSKGVGTLYTGVGTNGSQVFVGTKSGELVALAANNGDEQWRVNLYGAPVTAPVADASKVMIRTLGGAVQTFNSASGEASWAYMIATPDMNLRGGAAPIIFGDRVIVPTDLGQVGVLTLNEGKVLWGQNLGKVRGGSAMARIIDIDAEPVIDNGVMYIGVARSGLSAISLSSAQRLWSLTSQGVYSGLAVDANALYAVYENGSISALNRANGALYWNNDALLHRKLTRPVVLNNKLVVGDFEGYVHVLDANSGNLLGSTRIAKSAFLPDILLHNGGVILQDVNGGIYRITI